MQNLIKGTVGFFTSLLLSNLLVFSPVLTAGQQQQTKCGPGCVCGCLQGGPCTCHQQNQYPYQFQYQNQYQYEYNNGEIECCNWNHCRGIGGIVRPVDIDINGRNVINEGICCGGIWLPEDAPLFRPFIADPRQVTYSAGWRFGDNALTKNNIDVSYGDSFALYRWLDVWPWNGQMQIDLEGCLWAVFNPCYESAPLINADYYVAVPLTYSIDRWQFRLRGYHISSHIGDEFLLDHPHFVRKNPSAEYLDFFISHDLTEEIRIYGGLGWVVAQDPSYKFHQFYSALGGELRLLSWGFLDSKNVLYGCPIFGMHFRQSGDFKKHIDGTYILGYEFGKLCGLFRRLRFFAEYHDGYSCEGQFSKTSTNYLSVRLSYGY